MKLVNTMVKVLPIILDLILFLWSRVWAQFDLGDDIYLGFSVGRNSYSTFVTSSPGDKGNVNAGLSGSSWQAGMSLKAVFDGWLAFRRLVVLRV